jgi:hypothetical protein
MTFQISDRFENKLANIAMKYLTFTQFFSFGGENYNIFIVFR